MKEIKLNVPYNSQFLEVEDHFWNIRSCGGSCIKMIMDYYSLKDESVKKTNTDNILKIMNDAFHNGGYDADNGFIHDYAVDYFNSHELKSYRKENIESFDIIKKELDNNNPVIVSVTKKTLEQNKFHLILVVGYVEQGEGVKEVMYHESESTDPNRGAYRRCSIEIFMSSFRGKAIFVNTK